MFLADQSVVDDRCRSRSNPRARPGFRVREVYTARIRSRPPVREFMLANAPACLPGASKDRDYDWVARMESSQRVPAIPESGHVGARGRVAQERIASTAYGEPLRSAAEGHLHGCSEA